MRKKGGRKDEDGGLAMRLNPPPFPHFLPLSFFLIPSSSLRSVTLGVVLGGNKAFSFHSWHQIRPTRTTQGCNTWCKRMNPQYPTICLIEFNAGVVGMSPVGARTCVRPRRNYLVHMKPHHQGFRMLQVACGGC